MYSIAEIFHSVQGEGQWTGTPMMFVRLAGCCVGEYHQPGGFTQVGDQDFSLLTNKKHSICTTFDGQHFLCDTDYHSTIKLDEENLILRLREEHICITGGEPLMHNLKPLFEAVPKEVMIHVETSGTIRYPHLNGNIWWTVCPKRHCKEEWYNFASEFKILVGPDFDEEAFETFLIGKKDKTPLYLQPINFVDKVNPANLVKTLELLSKYPGCHLSTQLHKYLEVR